MPYSKSDPRGRDLLYVCKLHYHSRNSAHRRNFGRLKTSGCNIGHTKGQRPTKWPTLNGLRTRASWLRIMGKKPPIGKLSLLIRSHRHSPVVLGVQKISKNSWKVMRIKNKMRAFRGTRMGWRNSALIVFRLKSWQPSKLEIRHLQGSEGLLLAIYCAALKKYISQVWLSAPLSTAIGGHADGGTVGALQLAVPEAVQRAVQLAVQLGFWKPPETQRIIHTRLPSPRSKLLLDSRSFSGVLKRLAHLSNVAFLIPMSFAGIG